MRLLLAAASFALVSCSGATTKMPELDTLERNVKLPTGASRLENYDRSYARTKDGWLGHLIIPEEGPPQAQITTQDELPIVLDAGCRFVTATFDKNMRFVSSHCEPGY
jgi:hypothetical protein